MTDRPPDYLDTAIRAYTVEAGEPEEEEFDDDDPGRKPSPRWERDLIVIDTEAVPDVTQRLTFGCFRFYRAWRSDDGTVRLVCVQEGLFHADDLPQVDPEGFEVLRTYSRTREPAVDPAQPGASFILGLHSRSEFVEILHQVAFKTRATVVCFNFPFDLSRLAIDWGRSRGEQYAGGFSLVLSDYTDASGGQSENRFRPRWVVKSIDSKRALKGLAAPAEVDEVDRIPEGSLDGTPKKGYVFRGHLLDLRTLVFSLTDRGHTLESACEAFGVEFTKCPHTHGVITPEYIDYNREDVEATADLYAAAMTEFRRHPLTLPATRAYSPASIGKDYMRSMGIPPIMERQPDFPKDLLGQAMGAYFGGRTGCHIRRCGVPVIYCDFLSMYPTVNSLMGLWSDVTAGRIEVVEDTEGVRDQVDGLGPEDLLRPESWADMVALVQVDPEGESLPVRAGYSEGRSWGIGVNHLHSPRPLWYALPDVIAAKLIGGRAPRILQAVRLRAVGRQKGLKKVHLRGLVEVDPREQDLFQVVIEERHRLPGKGLRSPEEERLHKFLKVFANATSYGIYAEVIRQELGVGVKGDLLVHGDERSFHARVNALERPGEFAFPPLAATITAGARLMLALLERLVTDAGGTWTFDDTDAMAIVATEVGGPVPCPGGPLLDADGIQAVQALSRSQVEEIVARFEVLNPYAREAVPGSILEVEDENRDPETGQMRQLHCYAISAKRYVLYNLDEDGEPVLRKCSEHGLGHLLDPTVEDADQPPERDPTSGAPLWIAQLWEHILREDVLGLPTTEPAWLHRPALSKTTISKPTLLKRLARLNRGRKASDRVRPFNFGLIAHVATLGHPPGVDPEHFALIAPYKRDHRQWRKIAWVDIHGRDDRRYKITTTGEPGEGVARVKDYGDVLREYRSHPEAKSLGADGEPCGRTTFGLLGRRLVHALPPVYIGKEANRLEEAISGLVHDPDEVLNEYQDPDGGYYRSLVLPVLRALPVDDTAMEARVSSRSIKAYRAGTMPRKAVRGRLTRIAVAHARRQLESAGSVAPRGDRAALAAYLDDPSVRSGKVCEDCCESLSGRARRWCSEVCRKRSAREASGQGQPHEKAIRTR